MDLKKFVPEPTALVREAVTVIGGALIAAVVIGQIPWLKDYIKDAWK